MPLCGQTACLQGIEGHAIKKILLIAAVVAFVLGGWWLRGQLAIDSCLDNGGRWDYEASVCVSVKKGESNAKLPGSK